MPPKDEDKQLMMNLDGLAKAAVVRQQRTAKITHADDGTIMHQSGATARPVQAMDGWANILTGIGTDKDKRLWNDARFGLALYEQDAEDLYAADTTARRIVELLPTEALREGIDWEDEEQGLPWQAELDRLQVWTAFHNAWVFARLYGGAGILVNDGVTPVEELGTPLKDLQRIKSLVVLSRWELWAYATDLQRDITKPNFGAPIRYRIFPRMTFGQTAIQVHASRIIRFDGRRLPRLLHIRNNFWGDSVLTALKEILADYKVTGSNIANVLHDFRVHVTKLNGLSDALNAGKEDEVRKRFEIMNLARSVLGTYVLDGEDEMAFQGGALSGVGELFDRVKERLQAETDIPHTILFNEGPGGALAGGQAGQAEERMWYNTVHAERMKYLKPRLDQMLKLIAMQTDGPGHGQELEGELPKYEFAPLWQQDEKEKAETELSQARADQLYLDMGVRTPADIQMQRFPHEAELKKADDSFVEKPDPNAVPPGMEPKPGEEGQPPKAEGQPKTDGWEEVERGPDGKWGHGGESSGGGGKPSVTLSPAEKAAHVVAPHHQALGITDPAQSAFLSKVENDKRVQDARIENLRRGSTRDDPGVLKGHVDREGRRCAPDAPNARPVYSEQAQRENDRIVGKFLSEASPVRGGEKPTLTVIIGQGGSGKSKIVNEYAEQLGIKIPKGVNVNADDIKAELPGYKGKLAPAFHDRSSDISKQLLAKAVRGNYNVTWDATGNNPKKMISAIEGIKATGYKVDVIFAKCDQLKAAERMYTRYTGKNFGTGKERFVDPLLALTQYGKGGSEHTYDILSSKGIASSWRTYDTTADGVPRYVHGGGKGVPRPA